MKHRVKCLYKDGIVMMPKELRCEPSFIGNLLLLVEHDAERGSTIFKARLFNAEALNLLPSLTDVELVSSDNGWMLVRGHYGKSNDELQYRQSWFIRLRPEH